jgi:hypothetical protein
MFSREPLVEEAGDDEQCTDGDERNRVVTETKRRRRGLAPWGRGEDRRRCGRGTAFAGKTADRGRRTAENHR